jgi:hypothetical protein
VIAPGGLQAPCKLTCFRGRGKHRGLHCVALIARGSVTSPGREDACRLSVQVTLVRRHETEGLSRPFRKHERSCLRTGLTRSAIDAAPRAESPRFVRALPQVGLMATTNTRHTPVRASELFSGLVREEGRSRRARGRAATRWPRRIPPHRRSGTPTARSHHQLPSQARATSPIASTTAAGRRPVATASWMSSASPRPSAPPKMRPIGRSRRNSR